ncbi:MAG: extracellular solute-binding protein [Oscillospiraceae bacterium]|nr:extracellular solute-binding protein [Oscillospiraceae bacterium]
MNNKPMKLVSFFFIFTLIFVFFAACKSNGKTPEEVPAGDSGNSNFFPVPEETEKGEIKDSLPDGLDFGGKTLTVICRTSPVYGAGESEFVAEEENGENLNDAVYRRNRIVEGRLGIKLNVIYDSYDKLPGKIRASAAAGDNIYDLIAGMASNTPALGVEGLLMNLSDVPHIDFARPWWNQNIIRESTVGGKLNFLAGDANVSVLAYCMVFFVNKDLMTEYELPDIYGVIFEGKWTLDYMNGYIKNIHKDLDGDGIMDKNDLFGFGLLKHPAHINAFMEAAGIQITKIGVDGKPYFNIDAERMSGLVDKTYDIFYNNAGTFVDKSGDDYLVPNMFKNNQALLATGALGDAELFRAMDSDFGIIPYPKYDEKQEKYLAGVAPYYSLFCIPGNSVTAEMTGAAMEAMASESYKSVTPIYFDVMMKLKFARDETSSKIIDILRESAYIDFSTLFNESINNPWGILDALVGSKTNNFASWHEKNEQKMQSSINKLIEEIEKTEAK